MCTWECEVLKKYLMTTVMKFEHVDILCGLSYFDAKFPAAGKKQQLCGGLDVNNDSVSSLESPGLVAQFLLAYVLTVITGAGGPKPELMVSLTSPPLCSLPRRQTLDSC